MLFSKIKPSLRLCRFVESFWWMELNCASHEDLCDGFSESILPDGHSEIIFHFGDKVSRFSEENILLPEPFCFFIGQNTGRYDVAARGRVKMLGVKFYPHAASFLLRERTGQFNDSFVDLACLLGNAVNDLHENLAETLYQTGDLQFAVALIEKYLIRLLPDEKSAQFIYLDFAVQRITERNGNQKLSELSRKLGITNRYLEKLFVERVGIPPKMFAQIIGLQPSLRLMSEDKSMSLTEVAAAGGYFDQSHFIRHLKRFAGVTPSDLKRENLIMQTPFLT